MGDLVPFLISWHILGGYYDNYCRYMYNVMYNVNLLLRVATAACQELTTIFPQDDACMRNQVTFKCTVRGSLTLSALILSWSSPEYIGVLDPLRFTTQDTPGETRTSFINRNVITTLTSNTRIGGIPELISELRISHAEVSSEITCTSETNATSVSTMFNSSGTYIN
jgi:hypothetical protein